jgi:hypothetical protein
MKPVPFKHPNTVFAEDQPTLRLKFKKRVINLGNRLRNDVVYRIIELEKDQAILMIYGSEIKKTFLYKKLELAIAWNKLKYEILVAAFPINSNDCIKPS